MRRGLRNPALVVLFTFLFPFVSKVQAAAPTITSVSPTSGAVGASVTITGTNFGSTQGTSTVKFNGTSATATNWGATSIIATVPNGATTGNVVVTVSSVASNGKSFTVVSAPSITSLSITTGAAGAAVTPTGTNFGSTQGSGTVKFNGTTASVTSWNATTIAVTVPTGATTGNVVVFASGVNSNAKSFTVVPAPSIASLSTTTGAVGAAVTLTGTNFGSTQGSGTVKFNGTTASVTSWNATTIAVTVPTGATTGSVLVFASGVNSNAKTFTVVSAPSVTSLSTPSGAVGTSITITGTNFGASQGSSAVKFNGTAGTPTSWNATSIKVPVPTGATTGNVVVHASGVDSNGIAFTVLPTPSITSLSVTSGMVGDPVTITGTNFGMTQGASTVTFNGTAATPTSWGGTSIATTVPAGASSGNVVVKVSGVASAGVTFTVYVTPTITSLSPTSGAVGASVTITGTGFQATQGTSTVTFSGVVAAPTSWNGTQIKAPVPAGATTGGVVVTVGGLASSPTTFTVKPAPTITGTSSMFGAAGVLITITGTNFGSSQGSSTVKFNGVTATPKTWSATQIAVPVPSAATTGNLVVHTSGVDVSAGSFKVVTISSLAVSPANLMLPFNSRQRYQAIATNSDGSSQDIASTVTWTSANISVGTIDATGVLTAVAEGQDTIQAAFGSLNASTAVNIRGTSFVPTGTLVQIRGQHSATLLPSGQVLLAGGANNTSILSSAELYDPATKNFSLTGFLTTAREAHTATLLSNGKVLIAGGETPDPNAQGYVLDLSSAELYDPSTGIFIPTGSLNTARFAQTATLLPNGKVLIVGGYQNQGANSVASAELYDPTTGASTTTGSLSVPRAGHTATLLSSGKVLIAGGSSSFDLWATSEIYDPATGLFSAGPNLPVAQYGHEATLLSNGKVVIAGGTNAWFGSPSANTEIYDSTVNAFSQIPSMAVPRHDQTTTVLNDGTVLMVGGDDSSNNISTAEIFQPSSQTFLGAGATAITLQGCVGCVTQPGVLSHTATLLNDSTVLIAGGNLSDGTAELYEPGLPAPISLQITPASATILTGNSQQFVAVDDLGQHRLDAIWTVSDTSVATIQASNSPNITGVNPGVVTLTANVDGVMAQAQISVAPHSLQITPASAAMLIGNARQFTVVDERGRPSNIASWSVSDPTLAGITGGSSPVLTAEAGGTVTLTANVVGVTAQAQITISALGSFAPGTVVWSAPTAPGFTAVQVAEAVPSSAGPSLYSINSSADGAQTLVQALTSDGQQMWQINLRPVVGNAVGDGFGGLLVTEVCDSANPSATPMTLVDVDGVSGSPRWQVTITSTGGLSACPAGPPKIAIRQDGVVVVAPLQTSPAVAFLDGQSGNPILAPTIPPSTITDQYGTVGNCDCYTPVGQPIVDSDGSTYLEYEVRQIPYPPTTISSTLSLLQIAQDGTTNTTQLSSSNNANLFPGNLIPDGNGGVLATWTIVPIDGSMLPNPYQAAYVVSGSVSSAYALPFTPARFVTGTDGFPVRPSVVLGENGVAFATDGRSSGDGTNPGEGPKIISFNFNSGGVIWNYQVVPQITLSLIASSDGNGLVAKTTDQNNVDTVIRFDSSGTETIDPLTANAIQYFGSGAFLGFPGSSGGLNAYFSGPIDFDNPVWSEPNGDLEAQSASRFDFEIVWCDNAACSALPDTNQNVVYSIRADDPPHNTVSLSSSQIAEIKSAALSALQTAFSAYKVTVNVSTGRQGSNTVYVVNDAPLGACAGTEGNNTAVSRIYFPTNVSQAQFALNMTNGMPTDAVLQAIGEGIGNNAAHEIAHQLKNAYSGRSGKVVGGMGLDDTSVDTYNSGSCNGSNAPWVFTGVGTDPNKTPIHWEVGNADVSLANILGKK